MITKIEWDKEQQINLKDGAKSLRSKKEFKSAKIKISFAVWKNWYISTSVIVRLPIFFQDQKIFIKECELYSRVQNRT